MKKNYLTLVLLVFLSGITLSGQLWGLEYKEAPLGRRLISYNEITRAKAVKELNQADLSQRERVMQMLLGRLTEPSPEIRTYAAESFGLIGPAAKAAVPGLCQLIQVPSRSSRGQGCGGTPPVSGQGRTGRGRSAGQS